MKREFVLNCPGSIQTLSKEEFLAEADALSGNASDEEAIAAMIGSNAGPAEEDELDEDEVNTNQQQRETSAMLWAVNYHQNKSKPENLKG